MISGREVVMLANKPYGFTIRSGVTRCSKSPPPGGSGIESCSSDTIRLTIPISTARPIFPKDLPRPAVR